MKTEEIRDNKEAQKQLQDFVQRIENVEERKAKAVEDLRVLFEEISSHGFDVKIIKQVLKLRKKSKQEREKTDELLELYMNAIGDDEIVNIRKEPLHIQVIKPLYSGV